MFEVIVPEREYFDEARMEFVKIAGGRFQIEHSLLSISKWESKWEKPFFGTSRMNAGEMTPEEYIDYIKLMTVTKNVPLELYDRLTKQNYREINEYMQKRMTATTIRRDTSLGGWSIITAEIIYWQMIQLGIPFECQKWHINRLMTLIEVCVRKNGKEEKVPYAEMVAQRRALNAQRLAMSKR